MLAEQFGLHADLTTSLARTILAAAFSWLVAHFTAGVAISYLVSHQKGIIRGDSSDLDTYPQTSFLPQVLPQ